MRHKQQSERLASRISCRIAMMLILVSCMSLSSMSEEIGTGPATRPGKEIPKVEAGEYIVGEADVLRINVWKEPEISQPTIMVRPDGMISMPLVGQIKVSGITTRQIEDKLVERLKETALREARVTVTVVEIGSKTVYVTGQVAKPGAYSLVAPTDVLQIIARAGGPTPFAHCKSMFVLRQVGNGKKQKLEVDYTKVIHGNNTEQNISLQPGDTVVIP